MSFLDRFRGRDGEEGRSDPLPLTLDQWSEFFSFNGSGYPLGGLQLQQTMSGHTESVDPSFAGYVQAAYKRNGVVFACMLTRMLLFSEMRFQFQGLCGGRPGDLFGTPDLSVLENPWPNGYTRDLLKRAILDADLAGNFYAYRQNAKTIRRLRPDWVTIVIGSDSDEETQAGDLNSEILGYIYTPGGISSGRDPIFLTRNQVAHFAPVPDPVAMYRGMSWLTPIVREMMGDSAAGEHKLKFFENGATPNMVVTLSPDIKKDAFEQWVELFKEKHEGLINAYKTIYLGGGADATVVGANLGQIDFKTVIAAGETRIAAAAGVPPIIVGLSEGLSAATYSNYGQARRRFADGTMRPLWGDMADSMSAIIKVPGGSRLWYDDRDISFLSEDMKDRADIQQVQATAMRLLVDAGFDPDSVVKAVVADDMSLLSHTGLLSVQLLPPGSNQNGNGSNDGETPQVTNGQASSSDPYSEIHKALAAGNPPRS
jgi:phage portal protein BeeE